MTKAAHGVFGGVLAAGCALAMVTAYSVTPVHACTVVNGQVISCNPPPPPPPPIPCNPKYQTCR